jgi:hypothetical protein
MKNLYLILCGLVLAATCVAASAAPATPEQQERIAYMVRECQAPMGKDVCRVKNTGSMACASATDQRGCRLGEFRQQFPRGLLVLGVGGSMRITADEYFEYVDAGDLMCDRIVENCSKDFEGRPCVTARWLWRSAP